MNDFSTYQFINVRDASTNKANKKRIFFSLISIASLNLFIIKQTCLKNKKKQIRLEIDRMQTVDYSVRKTGMQATNAPKIPYRPQIKRMSKKEINGNGSSNDFDSSSVPV
jgi:hypothetical protein